MNKHTILNKLIISILAVGILGGAIAMAIEKMSPAAAPASCSKDIPSGCTVFTVAKGDQVFFGGNDDYINADSWYWVDPGEEGAYGAIWIGARDNVQQGVNEKGLAYDANGLPDFKTNVHLERQPVVGGYTSYPIHILHECATVEEVIEWVDTHQWHFYMHDQMQFADASGDAVLISAGADGEVVFTLKPPGDGFLVSTNFNVANPDNGYGYPCWRYETATKQLSGLVEGDGELTVQQAAAVLEAVHVEGGSSWTLESMVADLRNGLVYLYYFHQYDQPVVLSVADELANPRQAGSLSRLFPEAVRKEATRRYQQALSNQGLCDRVGRIWIGVVLGSLLLMIPLSIHRPRRLLYWLPLALILGPLAVLVWLIAGWKKQATAWQAALLEAAWHLLPITVSYLLALVVVILMPQAQSNQMVQILLILVLPLLLSWLLFQGPLLALASHQSYLRTLGQRLPAAWITVHLGIAGINLLAMRLVDWISGTCSLMELSPWTLVSFWTAVAGGACLGLVLILVYELWAVRRGYRAWSVLATGEGEVSSPVWGKVWWWVLLSFVVLIGGIALNNVLN